MQEDAMQEPVVPESETTKISFAQESYNKNHKVLLSIYSRKPKFEINSLKTNWWAMNDVNWPHF